MLALWLAQNVSLPPNLDDKKLCFMSWICSVGDFFTDCTRCTMVNHHHSQPFGRTCLDLVPSIFYQNP